MSRSRSIYDPELGKMVPAAEWYAKYGIERSPAPMVMGDIEPYRSVVTGEQIGGRAQHRAHLKAHDLVEMGNETPRGNVPTPLPDAGQDIKEAFDSVDKGHKPAPLEHAAEGEMG
jgi:hypothetical protein